MQIGKYYFDLENGNITCKVKFDYDSDDNKFILRDKQKEEEAISKSGSAK